MSSPTVRSLALLRKRGYYAEVVERWLPFARVRKDFAGFIDILALRPGEVLGVQTTSDSNVSARVNKITEHDNWPTVQQAGIRVTVHGWKKNAKGRWECREVEL